MPQHSAGILLYRRKPQPAVLLVHPGGPFWARRQAGAWQIPKGHVEPDEAVEDAARREVAEELGVTVAGPLAPLGVVKQSGGKSVSAFAAEQDVDTQRITSMTFEIEWPPRSGRRRAFPEVDAARWMPVAEARTMMLKSQLPLLDRIVPLLGG
ncbi:MULTISPECIES: NUDIX domain-containing protein [unclassified Sphingomonas]|uniref:NUDIX domain-containing protein n=1 Tax=unclassified Sphingomonas TaxID=196159 RepID=UPI0007010A03|nr:MULTISPECIES: NUDIX domain-containing protein [unclassified Sphingomonas]KQM97695.1 NUDIX hydrolase [Sphingomonas sp. Leaf25]KQN37291.1 NUDIX hydrolase [Sphingomonas sp. Leaf42]KQT27659.1 NUDIX hydrolase [Sphingomonas sp. Leaf407]